MKIYVASSWRNEYQPRVVRTLRNEDHEVYDFRERGFGWGQVDPNWAQWSTQDYVEALDHEAAKAGFRRDMDALEWCDACVLVHPCGQSAHLELGWAVGAGKKTVVYYPEFIMLEKSALSFSMLRKIASINASTDTFKEPELMNKMTDVIMFNIYDVIEWLAQQEAQHEHLRE